MRVVTPFLVTVHKTGNRVGKKIGKNVIKLPLSSQKCNRSMAHFFRFHSRDKRTSTIDALFGKKLKNPDIGLEGKKTHKQW
ncbi:hypothetical protein CEXT_345401 [Caerostris extrusa]|uniref:Ribosomal protein S19 n=1 Tax=Caerostris extrusa TaxID=172846 RepID=A0AAV4W6B9_CAEEX|nr:hypothetical protein CEXT_345401 [Caerostris extrusa]